MSRWIFILFYTLREKSAKFYTNKATHAEAWVAGKIKSLDRNFNSVPKVRGKRLSNTAVNLGLRVISQCQGAGIALDLQITHFKSHADAPRLYQRIHLSLHIMI